MNLRVPRDAAGDLPAGVREVLANVEAVTAIETIDVTGVRPTAFDIRVDAIVVLELDVKDTDAAHDCLAEGFGVEQVDALVMDYS